MAINLKSNLMVVLFRIVELQQGAIFIDGVDIAHVPLQLLRSKLAIIIPQDPVLLTLAPCGSSLTPSTCTRMQISGRRWTR